MIVNGVMLPDIPADLLAQYPYAVILQVKNAQGEQYVLMSSTTPFGTFAGSLVGFADVERLIGVFTPVYATASVAGGTAWEDGEEMSAGDGVIPLGDFGTMEYSLVWADHDIYEATAIDMTTGTWTPGDIWFPSSVAEPTPTRYSISKAILDDIVHAIQLVRNNEKKLKPEEIAGVIRRMVVLPSAYAESTIPVLRFNATAVGVMPPVYQGTATSTLTTLAFESSAVGQLT